MPLKRDKGASGHRSVAEKPCNIRKERGDRHVLWVKKQRKSEKWRNSEGIQKGAELVEERKDLVAVHKVEKENREGGRAPAREKVCA